MISSFRFILALAFSFLAAWPATAQVRPVPAANPQALFHDADPTLNANKQLVYGFITQVLEQGRWNLADKYMSKDYIQHNPNIPTGRDAFLRMSKSMSIKLTIVRRVIAVTAEGDMVMLASAQNFPDPSNPKQHYTTTWFDMWRIEDGKLAEHWEPATKGTPRPLP